jgi:hypothetical protein
MGKDKSILEKITGTIKDIASIASEAADHAMKAGPAAVKADERSAAYIIPLAADGLVSDPMMVPPIAAAHAPRRKRAAPRRASRATKARPKKAVKRSASKPAKKSPASRSRSAAKRSATKTGKKTARKARMGNRQNA